MPDDNLRTICDMAQMTAEFRMRMGWPREQPKDLAIMIAAEAGELLQEHRGRDEADRDKVRDELADVLFCALYYCFYLGIDPETAMLEKMRKTVIVKSPYDHATRGWLDRKLGVARRRLGVDHE